MMRMGRKLAGVVLAMGALVSGAGRAAADEQFDAQNFRPAQDPYGYVTVNGARSLDFFQVHAALYANWAHNPLKLSESRPGGLGRDVIEDLTTLDLVAGIGLLRFGKNGGLSIGADMPFAVDIHGDEIFPENGRLDDLKETQPGDLHTSLKFTALDREDDAIGIAVIFQQIWPTGDDQVFLSDDRRFQLAGGLILEKKFGPLRIGIDGRAQWMESDIEVAGVKVDDRFRLGAGVALEPFDDKLPLGFVVEVNHWTRLEDMYDQEEETPVEILGAIKYSGTLFGMIGGGAGLNEGVGAPDGRVFAAVGGTF